MKDFKLIAIRSLVGFELSIFGGVKPK